MRTEAEEVAPADKECLDAATAVAEEAFQTNHGLQRWDAGQAEAEDGDGEDDAEAVGLDTAENSGGLVLVRDTEVWQRDDGNAGFGHRLQGLEEGTVKDGVSSPYLPTHPG